MVLGLLEKIFGSRNDRVLKPLYKTVAAINALEPAMVALSDAQLKAKTDEFKARLRDGETLDDLLPEAFAVVREASKRTLGMRHFDVQLIGGIVLHNGKISEMKTGEGKTLVATLPVYLNALSGKGVHVVTVNDYLAKRDSEWMGRIYRFLGLTVGCIVPKMEDAERQAAYACDITHATNNELGFDFLRDNMKFRLSEMVQRDFNFAIVDEVDSILVDEARTPLIISGPTEDSSELYIKVNQLIPRLGQGDFEKDEKARSVTLTEDGTEKIEQLLLQTGVIKTGSLYDVQNVSIVHHVNQALRAHHLFTKDVDYIVKDQKVIIIDEFTGRMMDGRRYSEGLHQALEAKENVPIQMENQTLASITFQNYFRMYDKLAGMTGTAMTEASEFGEIYGLDVIAIPTNVPVTRKDADDEIYRTFEEKVNAILELVKECHARKQPVLLGTASIERSELFSSVLKKHKIPHNVLNARHHENEAHIIAQAGRPGAVTIATNMAGRGTDIQLGGNIDMAVEEALKKNPEADPMTLREKAKADIAKDKEIVLQAGGLYVMGTERHESRRIDNQLRGRSGRQGDPGATKFFLSLQDDLMRIFGSDRIDGILQKLGLEQGEAITHPWVNRAIEKAQKRVEAHHFEIRKQLLKFDDVMNDQRKVIYEQRRDVMVTDDLSDDIHDMRESLVANAVAAAIPQGSTPDKWQAGFLHAETLRLFGLDLPIAQWIDEDGITEETLEKRILEATHKAYAKKVVDYGDELMRMAEKSIMLQVMDQLWKDHLLSLDHLRQGIGLRAYGQRDPLNEYKYEAFNLFEEMLQKLRSHVISILSQLQITSRDAEDLAPRTRKTKTVEIHEDPSGRDQEGPRAVETIRHPTADEFAANDPSTWGKVARNDVCPCGSGKKFKHCHGQLA